MIWVMWYLWPKCFKFYKQSGSGSGLLSTKRFSLPEGTQKHDKVSISPGPSQTTHSFKSQLNTIVFGGNWYRHLCLTHMTQGEQPYLPFKKQGQQLVASVVQQVREANATLWHMHMK